MSSTKGTPKLRFPGFSGEWEVKKLGELDIYVSDGNYGEMYPKASEMKTTGVPFIRANNLQNGKLAWEDMKYISPELHTVLTSGHLKAQDILITTRGEIGLTAYVTNDFDGANINAQICLLRMREGLVSAYIFQSLQTQQSRSQFTQLQTGSALKQLPKGKLAQFKIGITARAEQEKIAGFLTVVDERITTVEKKVELLKQYKKGVTQKIFTQQIRFKDENGNNYPAWQKKRLGDIFTGEKGVGLSWDDVSANGTNKCILYGELYTKYPEKIDYVQSRTDIEVGVVSKKNDLLLPCSTTTTGIDLANATALDEDGVLLGGDISILRFRESGSNLFYAYYLSHFMKYKLAAFGQGSTIVHMYYSHYKNMKVIEPRIEEQQKIANFLTAIDDKIKAEQARLVAAKTFKKSLLQRMFV